MANVLTPAGGIFRPPRGGRRRKDVGSCLVSIFLSTPSARRATRTQQIIGGILLISIHALREEGDESKTASVSGPWIFLSTPSARRATHQRHGLPWRNQISIHALREEGDVLDHPKSWGGAPFLSTPSARRATTTTVKIHPARIDFYPRPPRGGRHPGLPQRLDVVEFLSTPSARRATAKTEKNISAFVSL